MTVQTKMKRDKAWKRQRGLCFYCKRSVAKRKATLEHRVPKSQGGRIDGYNIAMTCRSCNEEKGNMPEATFLQGPQARADWKRRNAGLWKYRNGVPGYEEELNP